MIQRLRRYARTARDSIRYEGPLILLWRIWVKLLSPVVNLDHQILFEIDLSVPVAQRAARVECVIEQASEADIDRIVASHYPEAPPAAGHDLSDAEEYEWSVYARQRAHLARTFRESALQWLRAGELCFVARVRGQIAHTNWIRFHGCGPVAQRPIRLLPTEVYTTEAHTGEAWRGLALHEAVLSHMLRHAKDRGCTRAYTITDLTKAGSRRGVLRVGWRQRGHHLFITANWLARTWVIPLGGDIEPIMRELFGDEASL